MTAASETETLSRETPALLPTLPEGALTTPLDASSLDDARAEARSWSPNTRLAGVASWRDFTIWCLDNRCAGLPTSAVT